jgi:hypothetical protein
MATFYLQYQNGNNWATIFQSESRSDLGFLKQALKNERVCETKTRVISRTQLHRQGGVSAIEEADSWGNRQSDQLTRTTAKIARRVIRTAPSQEPAGDILIRNVPLELRDNLNSKAKKLGVTVNDFLIQKLWIIMEGSK